MLAAAGIVIAGALTVGFIARVDAGGGSDQACGWDLSTPEGVAANSAYLARAEAFLFDQPAGYATPPPPDSPFWHGDCPVDPNLPSGPPVDEAHDDGDHADE